MGQSGCYFKGLEDLPRAEEQGGGGFKHALKRDNHEQLLASNMTWLVEHTRNLPFVQGWLHGSSLREHCGYPLLQDVVRLSWVKSTLISLLQSNMASAVTVVGGSLLLS